MPSYTTSIGFPRCWCGKLAATSKDTQPGRLPDGHPCLCRHHGVARCYEHLRQGACPHCNPKLILP